MTDEQRRVRQQRARRFAYASIAGSGVVAGAAMLIIAWRTAFVIVAGLGLTAMFIGLVGIEHNRPDRTGDD